MNDAKSPQGALGPALQKARIAARVSPEQMAHSLGMSRPALERIESGRVPLTEGTYQSMIRNLSGLLGKGTL